MKIQRKFIPIGLMQLFVCASVIFVTSCVNEDYDLNKINPEIDIDADISLPIGSTKTIYLTDIFDMNSASNMLKTDENGNYYLEFGGTEPVSTSLQVPDISLDPIETQPIIIRVTDPVLERYQGKDISTIINLIPAEQRIISFTFPDGAEMPMEINAELPSEILDIESIELDTEINFNFRLDHGAMTLKKDTRILFPDFLTLKQLSVSPAYELTAGHTLRFKEDIRLTEDSQFKITLKIKKIDLKKLPAGMGVIEKNGVKSLVIGGTDADGGSSIAVKVEGNCSINLEDFKTIPASVELTMDVSITALQVRSARVDIASTIAVETQKIEFGGLPDFLNGTDMMLDIYNPMMKLDIVNNSPLHAEIDMDINAYKGGKSTLASPIHLGANAAQGTEAIKVSASSESDFLISRRPVEIPKVAQKNIVCERLGELFYTIPEQLSVENMNIKATSGGIIEVQPGRNYNCSANYLLYAYLSFGGDLRIKYSNADILDNIGGITDLNADIETIRITFDLENTIPLSMLLSAVALDDKGEKIEGIKLQTEGGIDAGSPDKPSVSHIKIEMSADRETLKKLDGVSLDFEAYNPIEGVSLNSGQGIKLTNIRADIKGGLSFDLSGTEE